MTENYFKDFRENIIGINHSFQSPLGYSNKLVYADWTASGRNYHQIEKRIQNEIMPTVANTHTETNNTGLITTSAYKEAKEIIKQHVNAAKDDIYISVGSGMTGAINKLQRILGLRIHESYTNEIQLDECERPVVFITHMEHHSNQTSWIETIADLVVVEASSDGLVSLNHFEAAFKKYANRKLKIASITACSNVTGITTPYHKIAKIAHENGGFCFVDFACSAPYVEMDMHPDAEDEYLDAIFFSPHKFLGGPGTNGVLIFNQKLYQNTIPDNPGGGTVAWTNPWGGRKYFDHAEEREDGGTPAFLQTIKTAFCIRLKEEMGVENMLKREEQLMQKVWNVLDDIPNLHVLGGEHKDRLGVISFYVDDLHYIAGVKMLNDRFGIQTRGGCSCAGTYGHYLLNVKEEESRNITDLIDQGDDSLKPGWIRMSIHPTMLDEELDFILECLVQLAQKHKKWILKYDFDPTTGFIQHKESEVEDQLKERVKSVFDLSFESKENGTNKNIHLRRKKAAKAIESSLATSELY